MTSSILVFFSPDASQTGSQLSLPVKPTEHVDKDLSAAAEAVADSIGGRTTDADHGRRLCAEHTGVSGTVPAWNKPMVMFWEAKQ